MKKIFLLFYIIFSFCPNALANTNKILPPEKVFLAKVINKNKSLTIEFNIKPGYYLYKDKFKFETHPKIIFKYLIFSKSQISKDDFFGEQEIFKNNLKIDINYELPKNNDEFNLIIKYQGCSEKGICYNISNYNFLIKKDLGLYYPIKHFNNSKNYFPISSWSNISWNNNIWVNLIIFFIAGIGLSFTACIYPLIPVISSFILGTTTQLTKKESFILSLSYVQGISIVYAIIGIIASLTGTLFSIFLQKPIFIIISDILIFVLALSMFEVIDIQMPLKIQNYLSNKTKNIKRSKIFSIFLIGAISSLIIGPCVAPVLAFILGYIATNKNYILGALYLYSLALGMGFPIILICTFGINVLPKSGQWIKYIKIFFGFILLFICIYIANSFLPYKISLTLYFVLFMLYAITLIYYSKFFNKSFKTLSIIISILIIYCSIYFLISGMQLKKTFIHDLLILNPNPASYKKNFFTNERDLNKAIIKAFLENPNEPVYIKFYAKWCINCVKMEMFTLNNQYVKENINMDRIFTIDITRYSTEQQNLLKKYNILGPPAIFILSGYNKISEPLIGFVNPKKLISWINNHNKNKQRH